MHEENQEIEISFVELFEFIKRGIKLALPIAILLALGAYFFSSTQIKPSYQAQATVLASGSSTNEFQGFDTQIVTASAVDASTYKEAVLSSPLLKNVLIKLGNLNPSQKEITDLQKLITVRIEAGRPSSLVRISFKDELPQHAANTANALADELIIWENNRVSKRLQKVVASLETTIQATGDEITLKKLQSNPPAEELRRLENNLITMNLDLITARTQLNSALGNLTLITPALTPNSPVSPRPKLNAALAFILGLFLTYGALLLREALNTKFRSVAELAKLTDKKILAEFPKMPAANDILPLEASNYLRTNVILDTQNSNLLLQDSNVPQFNKVFLVTSAHQAEGKSSVARSLAESFARNDYKTLLIDADLRKPVIAERYNIKKANTAFISLPDILREPSAPYKPISLRIDNKYNLDIIPTFEAVEDQATELLSRGFHEVLADLRQNYEVVIVDSAPILPVADTLPIAPMATGVILVSSMESNDSAGIKTTIEKLENIGVNILGIVATNVPKYSGKGYGYGLGGGYGDEKLAKKAYFKKDSASNAAKATTSRKKQLLNK